MELALKVEHLTKEYPGTIAVNDVSFEVKKGSIHGLLGPNGAGKSTTMKMIAGLIPPTKGILEVHGRVGLLAENPPLYLQMKVLDYLGFVANINHSSMSIDQVMIKCGLKEVSHRLIGNLSKGFKQRVGIAQAIVTSPEIVILDEPTVGLDPLSILEIRDLIRSLKKEHTVLFSSHQLHEVDVLCSEITVIDKGNVLASGPIEEMRKRFQTQQVVMCELDNWSEELSEKLLKEQFVDHFEINKKDNHVWLKLFAKGKPDSRKELIQFFVGQNAGLLEISEQKLELEDLFCLMLKK